MIKLFERIFWHNNTNPALNETNLNAMSKAIDDIDDRVIELAGELLMAAVYAQNAKDSSEDSEAWAVGTRNGQPVGSGDPAYQNSALWHSQHLQTNLGNLNDVTLTNPQEGDALVYDPEVGWKNGTADVGLFVQNGILMCRYETE